MSLDITLLGKEIDCPDCKPCWNCNGTKKVREDLFGANITHNLVKMAQEVQIYGYLWCHNELQISKAKELIHPLTCAIEELKLRPDYYKQFNPPNGWGSYDSFVTVLEKYLQACKDNPEAEVRAWK